MLLHQHRNCADVIGLDRQTGRWKPVEDNERLPVGGLSIAYRDSYPICGSYIIEAGKRYCMYWTPDKILTFRTPEDFEFKFFQKLDGDRVKNFNPEISLEIQPAQYTDGRIRPGYSDFRIIEKNKRILFETTYFSQKYLDFYMRDFTADPDLSLADWDFFVSIKSAYEELAEKAQTFPASKLADEISKTNQSIAAGKTCPQTGYWFTPAQMNSRRHFKEGDIMPNLSSDYGATIWQWDSGQG